MSVYAGPEIPGNMILCIDSENTKSYIPPNLNDLSKNLSNLSLNNTTYANPGLTFNGTSSYAEYGSYVKTNVFVNRSMSVWFKSAGANANGQSQGMVVVFNNSYGNPPFDISVNSNGTAVNAAVFYDSTVRSAGTPISSNVWYNVVGVENHDTVHKIQIYLNGKFITESIFTGAAYTTDATKISIGAQKRSANRYFNGVISHVTVYDRSLSEQEVQQNFNALRGRFGL